MIKITSFCDVKRSNVQKPKNVYYEIRRNCPDPNSEEKIEIRHNDVNSQANNEGPLKDEVIDNYEQGKENTEMGGEPSQTNLTPLNSEGRKYPMRSRTAVKKFGF